MPGNGSRPPHGTSDDGRGHPPPAAGPAHRVRTHRGAEQHRGQDPGPAGRGPSGSTMAHLHPHSSVSTQIICQQMIGEHTNAMGGAQTICGQIESG